MPTNSKVQCTYAQFTEYVGKADLNKKIGGNHAFNQQHLQKDLKYKALYGVFFSKQKLKYLCKWRGYPQFSFWISRALSKFFLLRIVLNRALYPFIIWLVFVADIMRALIG